MSEEQYKSLTNADVEEIKAFWAGCLSKEENKKVVAKYPDNPW